jgi:hypothetical protein
MENYVALNYGKTTQIIHGNKECTLAGELQNNTIFFWNWFFPERNDP